MHRDLLLIDKASISRESRERKYKIFILICLEGGIALLSTERQKNEENHSAGSLKTLVKMSPKEKFYR